MIRNRRHLITTNKKFTEKFSYSNIIPPIIKSTKSIAPPLKLVTSSTTINPLKTIGRSETKVTRSGRVLKKPNKYIEQC